MRRSISGSCSASSVSARCRATRSSASTTVSSVGGAKKCALVVGGAERVADAQAQPADLADLAGAERVAGGEAAGREDLDRRDLPRADGLADAQRARVHAHVGDAVLDLEHGAFRGSVAAGGGGQQVADAARQLRHSRPGDRRALEDRVHERPPGLCRELLRHRRAVQVGGEERVVVVGEQLGERGRPDRRGRDPQLVRDLTRDALRVRPAAVGLVDEDQRRDPQARERAHQHARLRLHALDRAHHQHRAVEHAQHALDLRDEVGVAGRVDQVHDEVVDRERDDRGLDRDAAPAFERERVRLRVAGVDAAERVGDAGVVEQALRQAGLTGIDVRQDAEVQELQCGSCPPRSGWCGWT